MSAQFKDKVEIVYLEPIEGYGLRRTTWKMKESRAIIHLPPCLTTQEEKIGWLTYYTEKHGIIRYRPAEYESNSQI